MKSVPPLQYADQIFTEITRFLTDLEIQLGTPHADGRANSILNEKEVLAKLHDIECLKKSNPTGLAYGFEVPRIRDWYDFAIVAPKKEKSLFIPCNIKVTIGDKNDNLNAKLAMYYALTGLIPSFQNEVSWSRYFEELAKGIELSKQAEEDAREEAKLAATLAERKQAEAIAAPSVNASAAANAASCSAEIAASKARETDVSGKDCFYLVVLKPPRGNSVQGVFFTSLKRLTIITANGNNLPFQCCWEKNRSKVNRTQSEAIRFLLTELKKSLQLRSKTEEAFDKVLGGYLK